MGIGIVDGESPPDYNCEQCDPKSHKELLEAIDGGIKLWEDRRTLHGNWSNEKDTPQRLGKKTGKGDKEVKNSINENSIGDGEDVFAQEDVSTIYPLTDECHHYTSIRQVPWDIQKYWQQRHSIFSCYNMGIQMTDDAWFGVTPEPIANQIAKDLAAISDPSRTVIIDLFGGVGGNSIAFALSNRWVQVIAIEKDPSVIACGQHNAAIYGASEYITWINDDCFSYLASNSSSIDPSKTVVFASPPWGGPGYTSDEVFNLNTMYPYSLKTIHDPCRHMDSALYLPRTSDLRQLAKLPPAGKKVEVVQYCMEGASKALVAYIPAACLVS
ncbi:hypothetical protein OIDMADRAFT_116016 [Oidiodendron maius Zn]|uniref:Trimethylguanosine synthase n=1 Tax=Oidiodendron maius (strain Zn) TaxID=913774 RepID=A0A0C3H9A2_OIDMZ|nr:hypothetical protein OIDMADRAFT_116016 [Oidiodendron maius Zn]